MSTKVLPGGGVTKSQHNYLLPSCHFPLCRETKPRLLFCNPGDPAINNRTLFLLKSLTISPGIWLPFTSGFLCLFKGRKGTQLWLLSLALGEMAEWLFSPGYLFKAAKRHRPPARKPSGDKSSWVFVPCPSNNHVEVNIITMFCIRWRSLPQLASILLLLLNKLWNYIKD